MLYVIYVICYIYIYVLYIYISYMLYICYMLYMYTSFPVENHCITRIPVTIAPRSAPRSAAGHLDRRRPGEAVQSAAGALRRVAWRTWMENGEDMEISLEWRGYVDENHWDFGVPRASSFVVKGKNRHGYASRSEKQSI